MSKSLPRRIHRSLPGRIQPYASSAYRTFEQYVLGTPSETEIESELNSAFFEANSYESYKLELSEEPIQNWVEEARIECRKTLNGGNIGNELLGERYYSIVRELEPNIIVETGVRHGFSTFFILCALKTNGSGKLYSVDLPLKKEELKKADELSRFDTDTPLPSGKEPGWIIPETLKENWELIEGKSQRELPKLRSEVKSPDIFIHDSEHSLPCMLFEYEIAWEWIKKDGLLISDDIDHNTAFNKFKNHREVEDIGLIKRNVGYVIK